MKFIEGIPILENTTDGNLCGARDDCKNPIPEPHECPYQSDVNDDHNPEYCTCCDDCTSECAADI